MKTANKTAAAMIAVWFHGKTKTAAQLREAVQALADTTLFPGMTASDVEEIARHNEATQGIQMFIGTEA